MALTDEDKKRIDVLLAEYQACHRNRNHYDSIRWTIGSIFIATSLALFGISFIKEVRDILVVVVLMAIFSGLLTAVWYAYTQHVNPYVLSSIRRFHEIELELCKMDFDVTLHESVWERSRGGIRGAGITLALSIMIVVAWSFRILLLLEENWKIVAAFVCLVLVITVSAIHRRTNIRDVGERD